jgi:hypothetical protein
MAETKIKKVHYVIDYAKQNYDIEDDFIELKKPDLLFTPCRHEVRALKQRVLPPVELLPFSVDTEIFFDRFRGRDADVMAVFSVVPWAYPSRVRIMDTLKEMRVNGFIQESWPSTRLWQKDYVEALQRSKISINGVGANKSLNWKYLEPCACGTLLLTERAEDTEVMGFRNKENCVIFDGMKDMRDKINYYLANERERHSIARAGWSLVRERHSVEVRVQEMTKLMLERF